MPIMSDADWAEMRERFKKDFDRIWQEGLEKYGLAEPPVQRIDAKRTRSGKHAKALLSAFKKAQEGKEVLILSPGGNVLLKRHMEPPGENPLDKEQTEG